MRHILRSLLWLSALLNNGAHYSSANSDPYQDLTLGCGAIRGFVVNEQGVHVSGVRVYAMVADRPPRARSGDVFAITDENGEFFLGCVGSGKNGLYTVKEDDYYPDTLLTPFIDPELTTSVDVIDQKLTAGVVIHLPPKAGRLTVQIRDARSQRPIDRATLTICRATSTKTSSANCRVIDGVTKNGFSRLLPAIDYVVKASAPAHKYSYWGKDGEKKHTGVVHLVPTKTTSIFIDLTPSP